MSTSQIPWLTVRRGSVLLWLIASAVPFLPLLRPLLLRLFADSPDADLVLVPIIAFAWMLFAIQGNKNAYQDDGELNLILGSTASIVVLLGVAVSGNTYPLLFWQTGIALLIWPIWVLAVSWLVFGVGMTRRVWQPICYLFLASPFLFAGWMPPLHDLLVGFLQSILESLQHVVPWISFEGTLGRVEYAGHWLNISISSACVGSDSVIALIVVAPLFFVCYQGNRVKKWVLLCIGVLLAILLNVLRVVVLLMLLHVSGGGRLFNYVHACLGLLLFAGLALLLIWIAQGFGLKMKQMDVHQGPGYLKQPGKLQVVWVAVLTIAVACIIYPAAWQNRSYLWTPISMAVSPESAAPPAVGGTKAVLLGVYNDAETLGQGADSVAYAYSDMTGAYHRVEIWKVPSPWRLEAYDIGNCLTFHGDRILAETTVRLSGGLRAALYTMQLPPLAVGGGVDVYQVAVTTFQATVDGQNAYYRIEIATPIATGLAVDSLRNQSIVQATQTGWSDSTGKITKSDNIEFQLETERSFVTDFTKQMLAADGR